MARSNNKTQKQSLKKSASAKATSEKRVGETPKKNTTKAGLPATGAKARIPSKTKRRASNETEAPVRGARPSQEARRAKKPDAASGSPQSILPSSVSDSSPDLGLQPTNATSFPITGIGASAGGLEAFTQLLGALPSDSGMAFVIVQHLAPQHDSVLTDLLSRATSMPVTEVRDGMPVEPDHVYVIPPNVNMALLHGKLSLMPRLEQQGQHMPIDYFFRSLAADQGGRSIGVVLSGTASDGAQGLAAIKAEGGITFAQEPRSAKYDGMPRSAIAAGVVDFILPPQEIALGLIQISTHPYVAPQVTEKPDYFVPGSEQTLNKLFIMLRADHGVDFTCYKPTTIKRRIVRRMVLHRIENLEDYIRYIQKNRDELDALYNDILINVTSFFRDPEAFEALANIVFPSIIKHHPPEGPIRVWAPGCSTGEEAYSIAICWMEFLSDSANVAQIQIFATDISDQAIEKARVGIYPDGIGADVSPERLRRFFMKVEGGYQINKAIRDMCIFARQDVTRDPPFSKLDLISCRNVLIYLGPVLQKKVLPIFHYALNPGGFLLLGSSETVGSFADLFSLVDKKQKIYSRKATGGRPIADFATRDYAAENLEPHKAPVKSDEVGWKTFDLQRESDRAVLNKYAPPGVTVNDDLDILQFRGHTSPYLEPRPGVASLNLLKMLRDDLLLDVRSAIHEAKKKDRSVRRANLRVRHDGLAKTLDIEVIPLRSPANDRFFLILFEQNEGKPGLTEERALRKRPDNKFPPGKSLTPAKQRALRQEMGRLSQELDATQSYLQATIEDHDATNEALRSANEEVQSSNEELQSTNEELETAKEELQSANEELTTVNEELQNRNIELNQLNNDLSNLLTGVDTPILMLGHDLRIRRFNVPSEKMFNLIATDVARPISDIKTNIDIPHLEKQVLEVVDSLQPIEREIRDKDGRWYSMRIRPYRTSDNKIDGALVSFLDIDALRSSRLEMQELQSCIDCLMDAVPPPLLVLDGRLRVKLASGSFYQTFQLTPEETIARPVYEVGDRLLDEPDFRAWLVKSTVGGNNRPVLDITHDFKNAGKGRFLVNASSNGSAGDNGPFIVLAFTEKSL